MSRREVLPERQAKPTKPGWLCEYRDQAGREGWYLLFHAGTSGRESLAQIKAKKPPEQPRWVRPAVKQETLNSDIEAEALVAKLAAEGKPHAMRALAIVAMKQMLNA